MKSKKSLTVAIFLYSAMRANLGRKDVYAPTLHPTFTGTGETHLEAHSNAKKQAKAYAHETLKLEENLSGKSSFEIRRI